LESKIKYWKDKRGRTNKWIALQLGVRPETVSRWSNNKGMPPGDKLFKLADLLECNVDDLYERRK